ncbi:MAG: YqgE/AlgH family protein [Myxococcota bacterium]
MEPGILISSPQMRDENFRRTVVLLVQHNAEGALGLVVNRETQVRLGDVVEFLASAAPVRANRPVLWGGPVERGAGFVVFRGRSPEGWQVRNDVAVSASRERLAALVAANADFLLCLGYAGWGPGQLDREFEEGSWLHVDASVDLLFECSSADRYDRALARLGLTAEALWMNPINE